MLLELSLSVESEELVLLTSVDDDDVDTVDSEVSGVSISFGEDSLLLLDDSDWLVDVSLINVELDEKNCSLLLLLLAEEKDSLDESELELDSADDCDELLLLLLLFDDVLDEVSLTSVELEEDNVEAELGEDELLVINSIDELEELLLLVELDESDDELDAVGSSSLRVACDHCAILAVAPVSCPTTVLSNLKKLRYGLFPVVFSKFSTKK